MLRTIFRTSQFKRDFKALLKKHYDPEKMHRAIDALMSQNRDLLSTKYRDHALTNNWKGYREIHLEGDWLLIYRIDGDELQLVLVRTGSHDQLY